MGEGLELVSTSSSSEVHHGDQKKKKKMHAASSDVVVVKSDGSSSLPKDKNSKKKKNKIHGVVDHAPTSVGNGASSLAKKKAIASQRLWMRFDRNGQSEVFECDKSTIVKRVSISARDLRILASVSSHSANILAREKAMVINLEFIKAIITAEEVLLLDPLVQEVLPFVDQLRKQLPCKSPFTPEPNLIDMQEKEVQFSTGGQWLPVPEAAEGVHHELPFEFQVLEIALEVICTYLDTSVAYVEKDAYPVLYELTRNVSAKNLECVRSLKSNLTRLLARVQKVRDEIEHLLDDNEDMAHLYLTRKQIQNQQIGDSDRLSITPNQPRIRSNNRSSASFITSSYDDDKMVDLEMLLEAYFMQLDGTRTKILSVREYIDDTEDYVNIQLGNKRNELIQLQLILTIATVPIAIEMYIIGMFSINIQCAIYNINGVFGMFGGSLTSAAFLLFLLILGYARWKKLIGS